MNLSLQPKMFQNLSLRMLRMERHSLTLPDNTEHIQLNDGEKMHEIPGKIIFALTSLSENFSPKIFLYCRQMRMPE